MYSYYLIQTFVCFWPKFLFSPDYQQIFSAIVSWWIVLIYPSQHNGRLTILHHHSHYHVQSNIREKLELFYPFSIGGKVL